jgi:spoIIIJ-associated protein
MQADAAAPGTETEALGGARPGAGRSRSREQSSPKRLEPETLRSRAQQLTSELLAHMDVEASVSASVEDGASISVTIDAGENGAVLIGRRGTTLDALEHIINRMTTGTDPGARVRVALDVCGYRERRKASLGEVAIRLKQHALSTMKRVQITPLSPHDRVVFQEALAGDDSVTTRIVGSGFYRRVLVIPRGEENVGGLAEEFNEEGHLVGYPAPGGADEDNSDEPSDAASEIPLAGVSPDSGELTDEASSSVGKSRGDES